MNVAFSFSVQLVWNKQKFSCSYKYYATEKHSLFSLYLVSQFCDNFIGWCSFFSNKLVANAVSNHYLGRNMAAPVKLVLFCKTGLLWNIPTGYGVASVTHYTHTLSLLLPLARRCDAEYSAFAKYGTWNLPNLRHSLACAGYQTFHRTWEKKYGRLVY